MSKQCAGNVQGWFRAVPKELASKSESSMQATCRFREVWGGSEESRRRSSQKAIMQATHRLTYGRSRPEIPHNPEMGWANPKRVGTEVPGEVAIELEMGESRREFLLVDEVER